MDVKTLAIVFVTVFVAELGDKTQLATLLFAADKGADRLAVFLAASAALVLSSALGVLAGGLAGGYLSARVLHYLAGAGFVAIGIWTLLRAGSA